MDPSSFNNKMKEIRELAAHEPVNVEEAIADAASVFLTSFRTIHDQIIDYQTALATTGITLPTEVKRTMNLQGAAPDIGLIDVPTGMAPANELTEMIKGYIAMVNRLFKEKDVVCEQGTPGAYSNRFIVHQSESYRENASAMKGDVEWTAEATRDGVTVLTVFNVLDSSHNGLYGRIKDNFIDGEDVFSPTEFRIRASYDATAGRSMPLTVGAIKTLGVLRDQMAYKAAQLQKGAQDLTSLDLM